VPADQRPTLIVHQSFGGASGQPPTSLGAASYAPPADQLPTLVEHCSSGFTFGPTSNPSSSVASSGCTFLPTTGFRRPSTFRFCLWTRPPDCTGHRILQLHLRTRTPTFIGTRILRFCLPTQLPTLHRNSRPLTSLSRQPPTFVSHRPSSSALRLTSGFHRRPSLGFTFGLSFRLSSDPASSGSVSDQPSISIGV